VTAPLVRVCVTGPESTGKTTLARALAGWAGTEWAPEAARAYAERVARPLLASDVGPIAREHIALADLAAEDARARGAGLIVLDTDLVSTVVYARHYYGVVPRWVEREERGRRADLYLLCDVDVPWVPDGVRDRPADRPAMFALFRRALERRGARLVTLRGERTARWETARAAVSVIGAARAGETVV
jgi:NadR type nicotinamide-nucleotide adenylyltransferase